MDFEFFQGANIFDTDYFIKEQPMSGEEIAAEYCQTRQNISRLLKEVMAKAYYKVKAMNKDMTPFELAVHMLEMFGMNQRKPGEIAKFFTLFPPELKVEIEKDGARILAKYRKHR